MKQTIEENFENEEDITVEDCIEWLENNAQDSPSEEYLKSAAHHLRKMESQLPPPKGRGLLAKSIKPQD